MIVPRHVLGQGLTPPSDLVNIAIVGINGMGAVNAQAVMSQNIVAICDVDDALVDGRIDGVAPCVAAATASPPRRAHRRPRPRAAAANAAVGDARAVESSARGRRQVAPGSGHTRTCGASSRSSCRA